MLGFSMQSLTCLKSDFCLFNSQLLLEAKAHRGFTSVSVSYLKLETGMMGCSCLLPAGRDDANKVLSNLWE